MTELSGTLEGIGLAQLVSFLTGLGKSGRLTVDEGPMGGELFLAAGQVVGAAFDSERGLPALDAIGLALGRGRFGFTESDTREIHPNLTLTPVELRQHLEELDREQVVLAAAIPSLAAVPKVAVDEADSDEEIGLIDRDTLRLLLVIDGRRSVAELARERGLLRTLKQLARLTQLRLARIEAPNGPASGLTSGARAEWRPQTGQDASQAPVTGSLHGQLEAEGQSPDRPGSRSGSTWARWHRGGSSSS